MTADYINCYICYKNEGNTIYLIGHKARGEDDMIYYGRKGQYTGGEAIGILTLESSPVAFIPGDVNNATTYPFPVRYQPVKGFSVQKAIGKDP